MYIKSTPISIMSKLHVCLFLSHSANNHEIPIQSATYRKKNSYFMPILKNWPT